jgi:hypothetical protein
LLSAAEGWQVISHGRGGVGLSSSGDRVVRTRLQP